MDIIYSSKPWTVREVMLAAKAAVDQEAMVELVIARTNLGREEVLEMAIGDYVAVAHGVAELGARELHALAAQNSQQNGGLS